MAKIFNILYDGLNDLKILGAMPGTVKELSEKTGIPQNTVAETTMRLLMKGALSEEALKRIGDAAGYDVLRYSGTEIYQDQ